MLSFSLLTFAGIAIADRIVYQNEEVACSKSKLLTRIDITDEMSFSMDIQVNKIPVGHSNYWESIFHCGASNYPRLPSIFMHPDADNEGRAFQGFWMTIDGDKNVASPVVHSGETHRLEVTYTQSSLVYKMNGEVFYNNQQYKGHKTPSNQPCYAGNPWYNSAKAVIHNLVIRDLSSGSLEERLNAKIAQNKRELDKKIAANTGKFDNAIARIDALERKMKNVGKAASSAQSVGAMPEDSFNGYELADANKNLLVYCLVIFNIGTILGCISCLYWNQKAPAKGYKSVIPQYEDEDVKEALA